MADETNVAFEIQAPTDAPPGVYPATVVRLRRVDFTDQASGEQRALVAWTYGVAVEGGDIEIDGVTSLATGPRSKAYEWLVALLGPDQVIPGSTWTANDIVGRECLATIGPDKNGWPRVVTITALPKTTRQPGIVRDAGRCRSLSPIDGARCREADGHAGTHRTQDQTWP